MQYKFKFNLHSTKKNFNTIKWAQKIMNIYHKPIHHDHCLHNSIISCSISSNSIYIVLKKFNIIKWAQKIMNIYHKPIHHDHCLHKNFWSQNSIGWSVGLKNLTDSLKCLWIFFGIPHPVTNVCDNFFEIFSNFFHSLYLWYHAFTTNFIIFGLHLCFIEFKIYSATNSLLCFLNKIFDFFL